MLVLLADATGGTTLNDLTPIIASAGSLGFAVWFGVYVMMYHLPAQQREHREQMEKRDAMHADTIKELVAEMRSGRESYDRWRTMNAASRS